MSTYEYQCIDCKHVFTVSMRISEHATRKVQCPQCKSTKVRWHPAPFFAKTTKKS